MSRDLPRASGENSESALAPSKRVSPLPKPRHLSVIPEANRASTGRLTRGQVASRLNISVSTVRRYEGDRLHPTVDENDVRWFDETDVAALAAEMVNAPSTKQSRTAPASTARPAEQRSAGEVAGLVFE